MAIPIQRQEQHEYNTQPEQNPSSSSSSLLDALYCEEGRWVEEAEEEEVLQEECLVFLGQNNKNRRRNYSSFFPISLLGHDLFWEDEELLSLFFKEQEQEALVKVGNVETDSSLSMARQEAVEWMLKVIGHYGFSALTAILAINYLDRFISSPYYQRDKPWMIQLLAVTCLSLAAKVEENQVPLLLDLQVETKYLFEAKTIQRMELLVLSTLKWKMHPVTPISILNHIIMRLGLKTHLHWEFHRRCELLLLSVISDSRSVSHPPSILATATMMHVIEQMEPVNPIDYENQLLGVLKMSKETVNNCYELILEVSKTHRTNARNKVQKRKPIPSSPSGVIDAVFGCDGSSDSWTLQVASEVSSSHEPLLKKSRTQDQWVFVGE